MRPVQFFLGLLLVLAAVDAGLCFHGLQRQAFEEERDRRMGVAVAALGLSDLCVATEARYTRHPAVSDAIVPFMDHPAAMEHFPSGSFWAPPGR